MPTYAITVCRTGKKLDGIEATVDDVPFVVRKSGGANYTCVSVQRGTELWNHGRIEVFPHRERRNARAPRWRQIIAIVDLPKE